MFDAWQAQQKAQKDQERRAKTEAAAALQGYRKAGLSQEETKLAALKEQERLQKLNAEQQLRDYRSQLTEDEAKSAAEKQEVLRKKQEYEEQLRNNVVVSPKGNSSNASVKNTGLVSALAAEYSSPNKILPLVSNETSAPTESTPEVISDNDQGAEEEPEATTQQDKTPATATTAEETLTDPPNAASTEEVPTPTSPVPTASSSKPQAPKTSKEYKSSVKFMFGILTGGGNQVSSPQDRSKLVEGYLARADEIAKLVIKENNYSASSFESILLSMAYPTASSVEKDKSRSDINRIMVTVTISYTAPNRATSKDFKTQVIGRVRSAISSGEFTKLER